MNLPNRPTYYLSPVRQRRPWYRLNWGFIGVMLLSAFGAFFIIWCMAKAVR